MGIKTIMRLVYMDASIALILEPQQGSQAMSTINLELQPEYTTELE